MSGLRQLAAAMVVGAIAVSPARAQSLTPAAPLRGVPAGAPTAAPIPLSLADAIQRGLTQNLAAILEEQQLNGARSSRLAALSEVLPHVSASVQQSHEVISTAAFGFSFPGVPTVIGPFGVFDARLSLSTPLFDLSLIHI